MIFGELVDLISIDRITTQGWTEKIDEEEEFFDILDTYK